MAYADYDYYINIYKGGSVPADKFDYLAERASDFMDTITSDRLKSGNYPEYQDKIKKCCCALIENLAEYEDANSDKSSEKIGEYSVTYAHKSDSDKRKSMKSTVYKYLSGTGLLYRGAE